MMIECYKSNALDYHVLVINVSPFNFIETICIFVFVLPTNPHAYFLPTQMTRMYYFIIHLSIADLLTALLTLLPEIVWTATIDFYGGNVVCKLTKFAQMIGPYLR